MFLMNLIYGERRRQLETRLQYVMANVAGATFEGVKYDERTN